MDAPPTASFYLSKGWPREDHRYYLEEIQKCWPSIGCIKQLDLHRSPGECFVSFDSTNSRNEFLKANLIISGSLVRTRVAGVNATSVHILGCPLDTADSAITSELSKYGEVVGPLSRGSIVFEKVVVETGKRFANIVLHTPLPSCITLGGNDLRVWHRGQEQTCWHCNNVGHEARNCPKRPTIAWGKPREERPTIAWGKPREELQVEDCTESQASQATPGNLPSQQADSNARVVSTSIHSNGTNERGTDATQAPIHSNGTNERGTGARDQEAQASSPSTNCSTPGPSRTSTPRERDADIVLELSSQSPDGSWAEDRQDEGTTHCTDAERTARLLAHATRESHASQHLKRQRESLSPKTDSEGFITVGPKKKGKGNSVKPKKSPKHKKPAQRLWR